VCNLVPKVPLLPFPWTGRSEGTKRDPGKEIVEHPGSYVKND